MLLQWYCCSWLGPAIDWLWVVPPSPNTTIVVWTAISFLQLALNCHIAHRQTWVFHRRLHEHFLLTWAPKHSCLGLAPWSITNENLSPFIGCLQRHNATSAVFRKTTNDTGCECYVVFLQRCSQSLLNMSRMPTSSRLGHSSFITTTLCKVTINQKKGKKGRRTRKTANLRLFIWFESVHLCLWHPSQNNSLTNQRLD